MLHEVSFNSYNGRDNVQGWIYVPATEPCGIIQIVHGFGEHSRRYLHMIVSFMDEGYIVAADDHVGHGKTAMMNDTWGDWGDKGFHTMMEDEHTFTTIVKEMYPDLPYFMYGHSMGSFIARDYITKYGDELAGVTLCGTSGVFPHVEEGIELLTKEVEAGHGEEPATDAPNVVMGWMFGRCDEPIELGNEWICDDPDVQYDHAHDPFDAFTKPTTNRAFLYFCQMITAITGDEWAKKVPEELPIFNIAGDQDPVGQYGVGVYQVTNWLIDNGHDMDQIDTKLYSGYRHEIHNYEDLKDEVEEDIIDFFDSQLDLDDEDEEEIEFEVEDDE